MNRSVPILIRNQQILAIEIFKINRELAPTIFTDLFKNRNIHYNLSHTSQFFVPGVRSNFHGTESLPYLGLIIRNIVSEEFKELSNISVFRKAIKKWKPQICPCRLCKEFIPNLGFVWYLLLLWQGL